MEFAKVIGWIGLRVVLAEFLAFTALFATWFLFILATSRWRRVRVFIAFQQRNLELARELSGVLTNHGLQPIVVHDNQPEHDQVIDAVRTAIKDCDVVVALPGAHKSFVDSELLTASALGKPIVLIKYSRRQTLPDTMLTGYPVLSLKRLRLDKYASLIGLVQWLSGDLRSSIKRFFYRSVFIAFVWIESGLLLFILLLVLSVVTAVVAVVTKSFTVLRVAMWMIFYPWLGAVILVLPPLLIATVFIVRELKLIRRVRSIGRGNRYPLSEIANHLELTNHFEEPLSHRHSSARGEQAEGR